MYLRATMKKISLIVLCALTQLVLHAQMRTYIVWLGPYSIDSEMSFSSNNERKQYMFTEMNRQAMDAQKPIKAYLKNKGLSFSSFVVINGLSVKTTPSIASEIQNAFPWAEVVDVSEWKYAHHQPVFMGEEMGLNSRAVNGVEPGLKAVGAPEMWQMGYSGKGVSVLSFDTGVWPNHPAISKQFMANNFPYKQTWQGYFAKYPEDKSSSHGTHTIGTMLGLHAANSDTLGLAFKGYFIATDPIVSNLAFLLPLDSIIGAYNWAMNPDGNTATTYDIPDVICNSWGWVDPPDPNLCTGYIEDMLHNIELVGIANEYSAGNEGPGATTISAPGLVSKNVVNAFTVGAINGNNVAYPIANFSSRGPGVCGVTGSLLIKPEVVAPGVQVRSCVNQNGYSSYDGTSMAGPHVAGALMLLREAFPQVSARDLKEALYYSAVDLGDPGEDNTYGMGIIHVKAAYDYLIADGYTASIPADQDDDTYLQCINAPSTWSCSPTFQPQYTFTNTSSVLIDSVWVRLEANGIELYNEKIALNVAAGATMSVPLTVPISYVDGLNEVWLSVTHNSFSERDVINNNVTFRTTYQLPRNLPYSMTFDSKVGDWKHWEIRNPDNNRTWEMMAAGGLQFNDSALVMRFPLYSSNVGAPQKDQIISPPVQLPNSDDLYVSYWVAYHKRLENQKDTVKLRISEDCKENFTSTLMRHHVGNSAIFEGVSPILFIPNEAAQWKKFVVAIPSAYKNKQVFFDFESNNFKGASFWISNFAVHQGQDYVTTPEYTLMDVHLFPNPTEDVLNIQAKGIQEIEILDMHGRILIRESNEESDFIQTHVNHLSKGVYFIKVHTQFGMRVLKFIR